MMAAFDSYLFKDLDRKSEKLKASDVAILSKEKIGKTLATLKHETHSKNILRLRVSTLCSSEPLRSIQVFISSAAPSQRKSKNI